MRDRAWPFPARNVDASACETTSSFQTHCGPLLKATLSYIAVSSGLVSIFNTLLVAIAASIFRNQHHLDSPVREESVHRRLLQDDDDDDVRQTFEEDQRRQAVRDPVEN